MIPLDFYILIDHYLMKNLHRIFEGQFLYWLPLQLSWDDSILSSMIIKFTKVYIHVEIMKSFNSTQQYFPGGSGISLEVDKTVSH